MHLCVSVFMNKVNCVKCGDIFFYSVDFFPIAELLGNYFIHWVGYNYTGLFLAWVGQNITNKCFKTSCGIDSYSCRTDRGFFSNLTCYNLTIQLSPSRESTAVTISYHYSHKKYVTTCHGKFNNLSKLTLIVLKFHIVIVRQCIRRTPM